MNEELAKAIAENEEILQGTDDHPHLHKLLHDSDEFDIAPYMDEAMQTIEKAKKAAGRTIIT